MQEGKRKSPSLQGMGSDLNKKLNAKIRKKPYCISSAVKELEAIANDAARQKFPKISPIWLAPRKYRDDNANGLTKYIIHFLKYKGQQAERINNSGRLIDNQRTFTDIIGRSRTIEQKKWIKDTGTRGTSDISATIAGESTKIEVKISDRQSIAQKGCQLQVEQTGGIYIIVRSFEQFFDWYSKNLGRDGQ